jgi:hypothetical protein
MRITENRLDELAAMCTADTSLNPQPAAHHAVAVYAEELTELVMTYRLFHATLQVLTDEDAQRTR